MRPLIVLAYLILLGGMVPGFVASQPAEEPKKETGPAKEASPSDEKKAYRNVTSEKLERILADLKVDYQKVKGKDDGIHFYDFERNKLKIRLHNYQGKDLWIDAHFTDSVSLEITNQWNVRAKFSRAVLLKGKDKETVSLESQLDCVGGVSDAIIRQFVARFEVDLRDFVKFLDKTK